MKAYIFIKYESDKRLHVLEKKVIVSDKGRFEVMKLDLNGSYDWEECDVEFQPERLNPETNIHKCTDGKLFVEGNILSFFDKFEGWIFHTIIKCPICDVRCDSLNSMGT